ncbi:MAG: hypothetical protein K0Q97_600, partial [Bacillota bacterium]|nr:hypothetical protein [Bacillota bacterium]
IQILDMFRINKAFYIKNNREKIKQLLFVVLFLLLFISVTATSFMYSYGLSQTLTLLNALYLLPIIMMTASTAAVFFTTIYKSNGILFGFKDYDFLMSLPVKTSAIIGSRILMLNVINVFATFIILIPACIIYSMKVNTNTMFFIMNIILCLFIPMIPIIIATFLSFAINIISSNFKHTNIVNIILSLCFILGLMAVSFNLNSMQNIDNLINVKNTIEVMIYKYPMTTLYADSILKGNIISLLLFMLISIFVFIVFVILISYNFKKMNSNVQAKIVKSNYKIGELKVSSHFKALYKKDLKRYFSSPLYVLNTGFGVVFLTFGTLGSLLMGFDKMGAMLEIPLFADFINNLAPLIISFVVIMSCTSSCSISIEGNNLWILKTLPVNIKTIFLSKAAVNLTLLVPPIIFNCTLIASMLKLNLINIIFLYLTPLNYTLFISITGIIVNLKFPKMKWTTEQAVIKQSVSVLIAMAIGFLSVGLPIFLLTKIPDINKMLIIFITNIIVILLNLIIIKILNSWGIKKFLNLE